MADVILVTGGARSGKSARAETLARGFPGRPVYLATCEFIDEGMEARIAAHRQRRGDAWDLMEAPIDLVTALETSDRRGARLIDCLTIWLSNLLHHKHDWALQTDRLCEALGRQASPVVLVTSEVGLGIMPGNALAREFCDAAGIVNQRIAQKAGVVELVVAGLPLKLKS